MKCLSPLSAVAAVLTLSAGPASAGWDNVFQVACHNCKRPARSSYYASAPAPTTTSNYETKYETSCYEVPVTVMKAEIERYEVPVQVRSFYYDPVTTYTTRSFYNRQTCQTETECIPRTSYVRKEECNTVTKYAERTRMVPVQESRRVCERRPVTTITQYGPTERYYDDACDNCKLPPAAPNRRPQVEVEPGRPGGTIPAQPVPMTMPSSQVYRKPLAPTPGSYTGPVTSRTASRTAVAGEVVLADRATPRPNAKVVFLNAADLTDRIDTTADAFGNFSTDLPPGEWHVYLGTGSGRAQFYQTMTVSDHAKALQVVSR